MIAEVLAALQRIGRHPPPAIMVRPEDALQSVRTAIMLGAVLPEMRVQAEALARTWPICCASARRSPTKESGWCATSPRWPRIASGSAC